MFFSIKNIFSQIIAETGFAPVSGGSLYTSFFKKEWAIPSSAVADALIVVSERSLVCRASLLIAKSFLFLRIRAYPFG